MITVISSAPVGCKITMCQAPPLSITTRILARTPKNCAVNQKNPTQFSTLSRGDSSGARGPESAVIVTLCSDNVITNDWLDSNIYLGKLVLNQHIIIALFYYFILLLFYFNDTVLVNVKLNLSTYRKLVQTWFNLRWTVPWRPALQHFLCTFAQSPGSPGWRWPLQWPSERLENTEKRQDERKEGKQLFQFHVTEQIKIVKYDKHHILQHWCEGNSWLIVFSVTRGC